MFAEDYKEYDKARYTMYRNLRRSQRVADIREACTVLLVATAILAFVLALCQIG